MKRLQVLPLLAGLLFASTAGLVSAQGVGDKAEASPTRAEVKKERDEFIKTHRWDTVTDNWVLKAGAEPPTGMKARAEIKAERDEFIKTHRWDTATDNWVPLKEPRVLSTMSREQVRAETRQFTRTHQWDPLTDRWVEQSRSTKK